LGLCDFNPKVTGCHSILDPYFKPFSPVENKVSTSNQASPPADLRDLGQRARFPMLGHQRDANYKQLQVSHVNAKYL